MDGLEKEREERKRLLLIQEEALRLRALVYWLLNDHADLLADILNKLINAPNSKSRRQAWRDRLMERHANTHQAIRQQQEIMKLIEDQTGIDFDLILKTMEADAIEADSDS